MRGFKSFGHKKEEFPLSPGLTAIVGPNGNGKSNVVDALSFVLGQSSAKTLRASSFSGLIYHGSEGENGKKPAPYAKAKLHIVDDDNSLSIDTDKVTISRRVNRDGKSTYRINGNRSTKQEIIELLSGEMIGTEGYNFVMQGDVGKFIKMSSMERREIIDDLAGVAEFDDKKSKALSELSEVETKIQSQEGRLDELKQNMKKLAKDKEEALKFQKLEKELNQKKGLLAQLEFDSCKSELEDLKKKINTKDEKLDELGNKKENLDSRIENLKKKKNDKEKEIQKKKESEVLTRVNELNSKIETLRERLEGTKSSYSSLSEKIEKFRKEAKKAAKKSEKDSPLIKIEKYSDEFQELKEEYEELTEIVCSVDKNSEEFEKSVSEIRNIFNDIGSVIHKIEKQFQKALKSKKDFLQLAEKTDDIETAGSRFEELKSKLAATKAQQQDAERRIKDLNGKIQENKDSLKKAENAAEELKSEISSAEKKVNDLQNKINSAVDESKNIANKIKNINKEKGNLREKKASTETELKQAEENLEEYDNLDKTETSKLNQDELKSEVNEIETEIEKLKPINERAVDDYEKIKERYESQKGYYNKLDEEKQTLIDFMDEIDQKKTKVFMETYEEISENFTEIFSELSPGGTGRLVLENPEEPLEGGLEIEAKPKGKKLENVASLSGGEKALTGLTFIFAIQKTTPSALYVLDELDAHLDPQNQKGVAKMVKRFAQDSQIIVVTLRDSMMSVADKLFGVSMDDEDISHIVSVDLKEIVEEN